jgi:aldose 1-epimerase
MTLLPLRTGRLAVDLAPSSGGSIARFAIDGADILRPMAAAEIASGRGNNAAAYPLVPFSNRIAQGRLRFDGEEIAIAPNWPDLRHPMHGDGWARAWSVAASDARSAELVYEHDGRTGWPFRYRARQLFRLSDNALTVEIGLRNIESRAVPADIGLHPYFVRHPATRLAFGAQSVWLADDEVLPTERIAVPANWDFAQSRPVDATALDNCFEGWAGHATVIWPHRKFQVTLVAAHPLRYLVVYTPPGRPFFCVEPVSHANGRLGHTRLAAGAELTGEIDFRISDL